MLVMMIVWSEEHGKVDSKIVIALEVKKVNKLLGYILFGRSKPSNRSSQKCIYPDNKSQLLASQPLEIEMVSSR